VAVTAEALSTTPTPLFLRRGKPRFVVGVDLGQSADPTAIAVIEAVSGVMDHGSDYERHTGQPTKQTASERLNVRHLERLLLGMSYPAQVAYVQDLMARAPLCGDVSQRPAQLVVDESGVGRPVADLFNAAGTKPICVTITAGLETTAQGLRRYHVAKTALISTLDARLHTGELRFAAALQEAGAMKEELLDFRRHVSASGRYSYQARATAHDDLVLAVAIATWWAVRPPPPQAVWGSYVS
jgi:hypothetical protein